MALRAPAAVVAPVPPWDTGSTPFFPVLTIPVTSGTCEKVSTTTTSPTLTPAQSTVVRMEPAFIAWDESPKSTSTVPSEFTFDTVAKERDIP